MLRALLLTAICFLLALPAPPGARAQDRGGINGKISDKKTGHALPFATVSVIGAQKGGMTDSEGMFRISGLDPGVYEIRVQFLGYRPESRTGVTVSAGKSTVLDIALEEVVVRVEKTVEVSAERRLVEVKQGATIRGATAADIRNLPVQTLGDVLQQQTGITSDADQIHVRGGRSDETVFVVNGVANRDLVTGQSTAGQLNARSVAEVNVATGAYDVRYGNALSGVVEVKLKEGGDRRETALTLSGGSYGGKAFQFVAGGPDPLWRPLLKAIGLDPPGSIASFLDISGDNVATRFPNISDVPGAHLRSSYEDGIFGMRWKYGDFFAPSEDNSWSARYALTFRPNTRDKWSLNFSKRIGLDQGFTRSFIGVSGDEGDPAYPWIWSNRIAHAATIFEDNTQSSILWTRTLTAASYTSFQFSRYFFAQRQDVEGKQWSQYVEPDDRGTYPDTSDVRRDDFFIDSGDDNTWQDRRSVSYGLQWNMVQRMQRHEIEFGIEHEFQTVQYLTIEDPWVYDPDGLGGGHDMWRVHPWVGDLYVRDRLEYEGFTANLGLRADYWFLGREVEQAVADTANQNITSTTRNNFYEDTRSFFGRRYKMYVSPRVIVAHPITENSSFFFNYGQFTQNPSYRYVYSKLTSVSSESFPLLGNPDLNPQVSINYEVGAKHQFLPTAAINATFFVKDVYDYPSATTFQRSQGTSLVDIFVYLNGHFSRSKGFELELQKRRSHHWSGKVAYTFQQTTGKSSDANEQKIVQENGGDAAETRLSETPVRWNRPHKLSANFDMRFDNDAPAGLGWMRQAGINLYVVGESGRAYTPLDPISKESGEPNSQNAPFQATLDMRLNRWFRVGSQRVDVSISGTNILGTEVIRRVDRVTGKGRVWGQGEYDTTYFPTVNDYTKVSEVDDPSNYSGGAQWRLMFDVDF